MSDGLTYHERNILYKHHQFIRDDKKDEKQLDNWEIRLSRNVYDKLYKECAIIDLSNYKTTIGMRWRTEHEVLSGKGTSICANKHCQVDREIVAYEVPFAYVENGEQKNELVKVNICPKCAPMLFHQKMKTAGVRESDKKKKEKREKKMKREKEKEGEEKEKKVRKEKKEAKKAKRERKDDSFGADTSQSEDSPSTKRKKEKDEISDPL